MRGGTTDVNAFFLSNAAKVSAVEIIGFYQTVLGGFDAMVCITLRACTMNLYSALHYSKQTSSEHSLLQHYVRVQKECNAGMVIWYSSKLRGRFPTQFLKHCFGTHVNRPL